MYELLYILLYYLIVLSLLYCYKRYISPVYRQPLLREEDQHLTEYEYRQIEMTDINGNYHMY